jgi:hypothetical protein
VEETGAKAGMRERSGGDRFVPLSFLVFRVGGEDVGWGGEAARQEGGGIFREEATPCRNWSR